MGVDHFQIRKTARFFTDRFPVLNAKGEVTHVLEPPEDRNLRHPDYFKLQEMGKTLPSEYTINCLYKEYKKIYVNSRLEVFPCCYISDSNERMRLNLAEDPLHVPLELISLRKFSWNEILNVPFYKEKLMQSFEKKSALSRCIRTCGLVQLERNQEQNIDLKAVHQ
jgi:hypothetical protein